MKDLQPIIEEKLTAVIIGSVVSSIADTIQRGVEMVVNAKFTCNPSDPDPGAIFEAANEFAQSIVDLARSSKLADTFKTEFDQTSSVGRRLSKNSEFIKLILEIMETLPEKLKDNTDFSKLTTEFLTKYSDYDPKVQQQEIAKIATDWEVNLQGACDTLFAGGTGAAGVVCVVRTVHNNTR